MSVTASAHRVGATGDFPIGAIRVVEVEGREVGIIRTPVGLYAIGNRCPHQGAALCHGRVTGTMLSSDPNDYRYGEEGLVLRCPWHGYEFHIATGESVGRVFRGRVPVYEVHERDGEVYCSLRRRPVAGSS